MRRTQRRRSLSPANRTSDSHALDVVAGQLVHEASVVSHICVQHGQNLGSGGGCLGRER